MLTLVDSRRAFLSHLATAFAAGGLLTRPGAASAAGPELLTVEERYLWRMLQGLSVGEPFYGEWVLMDAYPPMAGGVTLVIGQGLDGKPVRVDVCRRAAVPRAPAFTDHLELFTMDGGGGVKLMEAELVQALQALADHLEDNEAQGRLATRLLTHAERVASYPEFMARASAELQPTLDKVP
jgi:hypothetical protein